MGGQPGAFAAGQARPDGYSGPMTDAVIAAPRRPMWQRLLWALAGALALGTGIVGIFVPLLPTTPFVLLAAYCFSRGSTRCERWLLEHPRFGPMVRNWRDHRAVPLRAKQLAWVMMTFGSTMAAMRLPLLWAWVPAACCLAVGVWLYRLPNGAPGVRSG